MQMLIVWPTEPDQLLFGKSFSDGYGFIPQGIVTWRVKFLVSTLLLPLFRYCKLS